MPAPSVAIPHELQFAELTLPSKPRARLQCTFVASSSPSLVTPCLVFLNGLIAPQAAWYPTMGQVLRRCADTGTAPPSMLAYDRWGQGRTVDKDPGDRGKEAGFGHDMLDVVADLHEILGAAVVTGGAEVARPLLLVANSVGCAAARLYMQKYPDRRVCGAILLDSVMASSDFVDSVWPDPDAATFDAAKALPEGVSVDELHEVRENYRKRFHPSAKNPEGLDRRSLAALLPRADGPKLTVEGRVAPFLAVVGHDPDQFAADSLRDMATPVALTNQYANKIWHEYNEDLVKLTTPDRAEGPIIATGCGHFIQRDDPTFVADLIVKMLKSIEGDARSPGK